MSDSLKRRIKRIENSRRKDVNAILGRFGLRLTDPAVEADTRRKYQTMMDSLNDYEKRLVLEYVFPWEEVVEDAKPYIDLFMPLIIAHAIEELILPSFVEYDAKDEAWQVD